jgi:TolB-like protein
MNKFKTAFIAVLLTIMPISVFAAAKTVAIVPFKVNAEKDMSFLRDGVYDMLSSRLTKEGEVEVLNRQTVEKALPSTIGPLTEAAGREIGRKLPADYVLFGSLTVLGNSISLDAKVVDVAGAKPTMSFFEQSEDAGGIISRINAMAAAVNEKMFGRTAAAAQPAPAPAAATAPQAQPSQPAPADPYAHPEKMLRQPSGSGGGAGSPFAASEESAREFSPQFWKSAAYKLAFNGIALGDVDGDGKIETVVITADKVIVYRYEQQRFYQVTEYEVESGINIGVDVADINSNGMPEIIVTAWP